MIDGNDVGNVLVALEVAIGILGSVVPPNALCFAPIPTPSPGKFACLTVLAVRFVFAVISFGKMAFCFSHTEKTIFQYLKE